MLSKFMKKLSEYSVKEILAEDPYTLVTLFSQEYNFEIPEMIDSVDDLKNAGTIIGKLVSAYSYLVQLSVYAKIDVRNAKKNKEDKAKIDDAIDRKAVIDAFVDSVDMKYKAVSRMLTIKQQINEELKFL